MVGEGGSRRPGRKQPAPGVGLPQPKASGAPGGTPAPRRKPTVVPLRPGDQFKSKVSNFRCRACGCPWFKATVTIDQVTLRPGVVMSEKGAPAPTCHQCGREARFDR